MSQEILSRPTSRTGLVTHKGCLDGTGCAWVFIHCGGLRENVIFKPPFACSLTHEEASRFDEVWFADLCPDVSGLVAPAGGKPYRVFDHHLSNFEKHRHSPHCRFSMEHSGTSLLAMEMGVPYDKHLGRLIEALEAYDLGKFDNKNGMLLADAAASMTQDEMLSKLVECGVDILYDQQVVYSAEAMSRARTLYATRAAERALYLKWVVPNQDGGVYSVGVSVSPTDWKNDVAVQIMQRADLAIVIDVNAGMVSLRSHVVDCSALATAYGGGGHRRAAGFKMNSLSMLQKLFDEVMQ